MSELIPGTSTTPSGSPTAHDVVGVGSNRGAVMIHGSRRDDFAFQLEGAPSTLGGTPSTQTWQSGQVESLVNDCGFDSHLG